MQQSERQGRRLWATLRPCPSDFLVDGEFRGPQALRLRSDDKSLTLPVAPNGSLLDLRIIGDPALAARILELVRPVAIAAM